MGLLPAFAFSHDAFERLVLPGDDLLPNARAQVTHHVDIHAPPAAVWPWLVQMGRRRAGWYSWDILDNGGVPSAERIVPELQSLAVGDVLPIKERGPDGFSVLMLDSPKLLVVGDPALLPGKAPPNTREPRGTWTFWLEPLGDGGTRLVVRVRADYEPTVAAALLRPLIGAMHEVMQRKQLRELKRRVESRLEAAWRHASP